ncbi:hypothetical protein G7054_g13710 [Neopestalotiopsis clavispora]|nr:hypothetical protein G7054_g13710 [Neopestalotiopsis clavispora]
MSTPNNSSEGSVVSDLALRDDVRVVQISETVRWCIPKDTSKLSEVQKRIFYMQRDIMVMVAQLQKQTDALWEAVSRIEEESAPSCRNGGNQDKSAIDNE